MGEALEILSLGITGVVTLVFIWSIIRYSDKLRRKQPSYTNRRLYRLNKLLIQLNFIFLVLFTALISTAVLLALIGQPSSSGTTLGILLGLGLLYFALIFIIRHTMSTSGKPEVKMKRPTRP